MYTIVGYKKNSGKLDNGKDWSNFTLHCTKNSSDVNFVGSEVQLVKVPTKTLQGVFSSCDDMLGCNVNFMFDMRSYGGQQKVVVIGIDIID